MNIPDNDSIDFHKIIARPLYFGLFSNVLIPAGLLMVCYYFYNNTFVPNRIGGFSNSLYWIIGFLSVAQAGVGLWLRYKKLSMPMISRIETFERDFGIELAKRLQPVFLIIAGISGYGYLYFFLTGRFTESAFLVVLSFIVFQVVRPRLAMVRKLLAHQRELVEQGNFMDEGRLLP